MQDFIQVILTHESWAKGQQECLKLKNYESEVRHIPVDFNSPVDPL